MLNFGEVGFSQDNLLTLQEIDFFGSPNVGIEDNIMELLCSSLFFLRNLALTGEKNVISIGEH